MLNALQDRPRTVPAPAGPPRRRTPLRVGGLVLASALALLGAGRALDALPHLSSPFSEQVVDRDRPALVLALADLSEYHAAQGSFQVVVDREEDTRFVPGFVKGERTTYLAVGSVDGLVDFRGLGEGAVQVAGTAVTITLPQPRLGQAVVDLEQSRVVARDRGLLDRVGGAFSDDPTSEREVALMAEGKIADAAAASDLLRRAEDNARTMLTGLARSFGYTDVTVRFDGDAAA